MRDATDDVAPEAHRLAHEGLAVGEREDAVLRERDEPEVDDVGQLLAKLEERSEGNEVRIADVDVRADEPGALADLPEDRLARAVLHVLVGERALALGPREDALDERAGLVVTRLADGEHSVEVDMRVNEGR